MNELLELLLMSCIEEHERSSASRDGADRCSYWEQRADECMDLRIAQEMRVTMTSGGFISPLPKKLEAVFSWT